MTIVTSSKSKEGTLELLKEFNFPINEKTKDTYGENKCDTKNLKRIKLVKKYAKKESLKKIINNRKLELSERFEAQLKLNKLPKNSAKIRIRNRWGIWQTTWSL